MPAEEAEAALDKIAKIIADAPSETHSTPGSPD
jgi:hypothetical protein